MKDSKLLRFYCKLVILSFLLFAREANAQDSYNFVQFFFNQSLINPSLTGIDGQPAAFLSYKKQWMGIKGAPSVGHFSIQMPTMNRVSFGLNFNNDVRGVLGTSSMMVSSSYNVPIDKNVFFRFGFSLGAAWNRTDVNGLVFADPGSDRVLSDILNASFQPLGNAGISIHTSKLHAGIAVPNLFQPVYLAKDPFTFSKVAPFESIIIHSSYRLYFSNDQNVFEPYLNYRLNASIPSQIEAAGIIHLQNKLWFGGSYKQDFGISGIFGINLNNEASLGYAYTIKNVGINQLGRPSHEVQVAYLFGKHNKNNPVYSLLKTEKRQRHTGLAKNSKGKKPASVAASAPLKTKPIGSGVVSKPTEKVQTPVTQPAVAAAKKDVQTPVQVKKDSVSVPPPVTEQPKLPVTEPAAMPDQAMLKKAASGDTVGVYKEERATLNAFLAENAFGTHDDPHQFLVNPREEIQKKGNGADELGLASYVISGAFIIKSNAEHFTAEIRKLGFTADFGQLSLLKIWYVYISKQADISKARSDRDELRQNKIFKSAWVLTVQQ